MSLYVLGDPHLSLGSQKPMDIFAGWDGYVSLLEENWKKTVQPDDTILLVGDISWALKLEETKADFDFLEGLPGRKILLKGNHDLWWNTMTKMRRFVQENGFHNIDFLHNNCYAYENIGLCGTRGWFYEEEFQAEKDEKVFKRELIRLEASLKAAEQMGL